MCSMRKNIVERIKKNNKLHYLAKCIKNLNNNIFVSDVLDLNNSPFIVKFHSLGNLNKDKTIYLLESGDTVSGFFAEYRRWLEAFYFADRFGFLPVVSISKKSFYAEEGTIFETDNPFEYYFEQPSNISEKDARESYNVVLFSDTHRKLSNDGVNYWGYNVTDLYVSDMAVINKKYMRLNRRVEKDLKLQIFEKLHNKKTLGVHIRGTDFKMGYDYHPTLITPEQFLENAEEVLTNSDFEQVFLATDASDVIELFQNKFKDKLVHYTDVERSSGQTSVVFSDAKRDNHRYSLGYEVLRDMHTLAACDGLIAGLSSVSTCARIEKRSNYDYDYEYLNIISNGINNCERSAEKDMQKLKEKLDKNRNN